jgi:hypothetical protein
LFLTQPAFRSWSTTAAFTMKRARSALDGVIVRIVRHGAGIDSGHVSELQTICEDVEVINKGAVPDYCALLDRLVSSLTATA